MVPAVSHGIPPVPRYSGTPPASNAFRVRGSHPLRPAFPGRFPYAFSGFLAAPTTPRAPRRPRFGLIPFRSPLLGESLVIFSSSAYLDVSVRRVRLPCRDGPCGPGCPIRTSADRRPFAPTRGFSQLATSFIASESQGILRAPLSNFFVLSVYRYTRLYSRSCTLASSSPSCH